MTPVNPFGRLLQCPQAIYLYKPFFFVISTATILIIIAITNRITIRDNKQMFLLPFVKRASHKHNVYMDGEMLAMPVRDNLYTGQGRGFEPGTVSSSGKKESLVTAS